MNPNNLFIEKLTISELFRAVKIEQKLFWGNETAPIVCALGDYGNFIANNYYEFSELEREHIFAVIEEGFNSDDNELSTAIATGLIEAMDSAASKNPEKWMSIKKSLGHNSNAYLDAWLKRVEIISK